MDPSTIDTFEFFMSASHIKLTCPTGKVMNGTGVEFQVLECGLNGWSKPEWCVSEKERRPSGGDPQTVLKYCMPAGVAACFAVMLCMLPVDASFNTCNNYSFLFVYGHKIIFLALFSVCFSPISSRVLLLSSFCPPCNSALWRC